MDQRLEFAAKRLRSAYGASAVPPLRDVLDPLDGEAAYAIQAINTRVWTQAGRRISGRKIGLTAAAVQRQLGVDQPDYGVLFADMEVPDGGVLAAAKVLQPKVEGEVALILGRDLDHADAGPQDVLAACEFATAAIEIVDSRIADWKITFADTVADNGSSAFYVLGSLRRRAADIDLYACGLVLEVDGEIASLGAGAASLGHPLNAAAWLARTLAVRGEPLREGDVILSGALGPMVAVQPGQIVRSTVGGLGSVSFQLEGAAA